MKLELNDLSDLDDAASSLLANYKSYKKIGFYGNLGSGKTTFIKSICKNLSCDEIITSPTYSIINNYIFKEGFIDHIDLYRLNNIQEALDIGIEDYLYNDSYCFIEWPEIIEPILPEKFLRLNFEVTLNNKRIITIGAK